MRNLMNQNELGRRNVTRRVFLFAAGAGAVVAAFWRYTGIGFVEADSNPKMVKIVNFSDAGVREDTVMVPMIVKPESEWKKLLPHDAFEVARHADTERPFTGALLEVHDKGVFRCVCCDTALFSSATKFDSGAGWPSFWQPIAKENVIEHYDNSFGMERTSVSCRRCEAHVGHVFDDGPKPTGLRYCMNSVAMKFAKASAETRQE
jgi:peptide-methionine (R)-S-oxide reductase